MVMGDDDGFVSWMFCFVVAVAKGRLRSSGFGFAFGVALPGAVFNANVTGIINVIPMLALNVMLPLYVVPDLSPVLSTETINGFVVPAKMARGSLKRESQFPPSVVSTSGTTRISSGALLTTSICWLADVTPGGN
jgi:hypothetical protein